MFCCRPEEEAAEAITVHVQDDKESTPAAPMEAKEQKPVQEPKTVDEKLAEKADVPVENGNEAAIATTENASEEKKPDEKKVTRKPVPLLKMFSLATPGDLLIFLLGVLGAMVSGLAFPSMVLMMGRMLDSLGDSLGAPKMSENVGIMVIVASITIGAGTMQAMCFRWFSASQASKMCKLYYEAVLFKDISWFDSRDPAALPSEIIDDVGKFAEALADKLGTTISSVTTFFAGLGIGFSYSPLMALVSMAFVPMLGVGAGIVGMAAEAVMAETQTQYTQAAAAVEECLFALRTVVAFGGERGEIQRYEKAVVNARAAGVKQAYLTAFGMGWVEGFWALGSAICLYYGMTLVYDGKINVVTDSVFTIGDIITVFFSVLIAGFMLGLVEPGVKAMNAGRIAAARCFEVVAAPAVIQCQKNDSRKSAAGFESFELQEVHFSYPARPTVSVLNGLSLKILKGQKVAIVGESGSGKSTVMSLLERFYDPTQGNVLLNGENLRDFAPATVRSMIGYVGQEPVLFATSVEKNILWGWPSASEEDLEEAMVAAQLDFVNDMPLRKKSFVGVGGSQFSGGQKQRIAIARALLRKPKLLFLDEATSALDSASERMIQETIENVLSSGIGDQPVTSVAIAHRLSTVQNCDVIYALKSGVVAEHGSHDQLMEAKGIYYALAAAQGLSESMSTVRSGAAALSTTSEVSRVPTKPSGLNSGAPADDADSTCTEQNANNEERQKKIAKAYKVPYSQILSYNKPEWPLFVPGILGALAHGLSQPVQAYLLVSVMDAFMKSKDEMRDAVTELTIIFACIALITGLVAGMHYIAFGILSEALTQRLRVAILRNVLRQEVGFHDNPAHTPGLIGMALQSWTFRIRVFLADLEAKANVFANMVGGLTIAFVGSWQMTLTSFVAGPVLAVATGIQFMFMFNAMNASSEEMKAAQQLISDTVQNARTVHAGGMERPCVERYTEHVKAASGGLKDLLISGLAFGIGTAAPLFYMGFGFWFADWLVQNGHGDFKGVMLAVFGTIYAAMGAGQAGTMVGNATSAKAACHDMFKVLNRKSLIDGLEPIGETPAWASQQGSRAEAGRIEFQNVQFCYPFRKEVMVLRGVDFKIESGQSVGLVGPSGGGKSTIMALLQRFYDPTEGSVFIGTSRTPLSNINIRWWRKQIGYVGQEPILFNTTVRANVLYGMDAEETVSEERLAECKRMAHLDFLDKASSQGWETEVGPRGGRLSGGQKQRVAICRALVRDPAVILLDEATSALDTESERVVQLALEEARQGRTSIAIAHRLSTIQDCDVILVASDGVIIESGSHAELMEKEGVYFKLKASANDEDEGA